MTTRKFTISVPEGIDREIRQAAEAEGVPVSAWIARAAEEATLKRARLAAGLAAVAEWEAEHGAFTDTEKTAADAELAALGVLPGQQRRAG
jgi:hypothetical protein